MSWIQKLYETYECADTLFSEKEKSLLPVGHISQQAHIQIILDGSGKFVDAEYVDKEDTIVPATEDSASRTGKLPPPHPLCDKILYIAKDYPEFGGDKSFFEQYRSLLYIWNQECPHNKLRAILNYIDNGHVVSDLVQKNLLYINEKNLLLTSWPDRKNKPPIFKMVTKQGEAFVRWIVQIPNEKETHTWKDKTLIDSWKKFVPQLIQKKGVCMVTGEENVLLGTKHPKGVRYSGDGTKLISSNDDKGFTYLGRFINSEQACSIGYLTSQKAHNALYWLIRRQAFRKKDQDRDQVIVAWEVSGRDIPSPRYNSYETFHLEDDDSLEININNDVSGYKGDFGQLFARKLNAKIAGYKESLGSSKDIVVMGLDSVSANKGRMAITYYRELTGSEFLERLEAWHKNFAWFQNYSKDLKFCGAPSPEEIAETAYGQRLNPKLRKMTVNRILPCIIDGALFPKDLVQATLKRASNRLGLKRWEWEKVLGIACALFKGEKKEGGYRMALETERDSRDYLYGRLLAVAERLEYVALKIAEEERDTNAARYMHRFSERPYSTWPQIVNKLAPYKTRLRATRTPFLEKMENLLGEIHSLFKPEEFKNDAPLTGEFLLGYYCQRRELRPSGKNNAHILNSTNMAEEEKKDGAQ